MLWRVRISVRINTHALPPHLIEYLARVMDARVWCQKRVRGMVIRMEKVIEADSKEEARKTAEVMRTRFRNEIRRVLSHPSYPGRTYTRVTPCRAPAT
ncbi:MAG: hypothetical protein GXO32_01860 [Crenarchaeota archaeon]|nr:hypothetical protein [Thermoproteota archaeon]